MKLVLENVTKNYKEKKALRNINAQMSNGGLIGVIGKNGAGKTTLLKLLSTIIKPSSGKILLDGQNIAEKPSCMRAMLGYLPQDVSVYPNLTAMEYLHYVAAAKGMKRKEASEQIDQLILEFHLSEVKDRRMSGYSGGMKQKVGLICALLKDPQIILADEPTTGLDPAERIAVRNRLSALAKDRIVILSTHIVSDIEAVASQVLMLREGKLIFCGSPYEILSKADGCVWEYTVSFLPENMKGVSNMMQTKKGIYIRQVSRDKPERTAVAVSSTLEDACLFALEGL
ncbi:MAG: ABC transporter ATP-binding protein [Peptostreptococcaceae bacterium]|nr:ABC transporter ATP-binding protein [Peptostreptococcaceae bacterium]